MNHTPLKKTKTLQVVNPKLAKEWHPSKNAPLTPDDVSFGTIKRVWWLCSKGHEWNMKVGERSRGKNCPYCARQKAIKKFNILQVKEPKLVSERHPIKIALLTPNKAFIDSKKTVTCMCSKGHEWEALASDMSSGRVCPYCSGNNQFQTINPEQVKQWLPSKNAPLTPHDVATGVTKGKNKNILQVVNPKLASEWHPTKNASLKPNDVTNSSGKKVWWVCSKGHEWNAAIYSRSSGRGCPYCAGKKVNINNSLQTTKPELAKEWHSTKNASLTPNDVTFASNKKAWWICSKGHEWNASINHRSMGTGCPYCAGRKVDISNCLQTINPELAKQWHPTKNAPLTPKDVTFASQKKVWWVCSKGHEWEAIIGSRSNGCGCPYCSNLWVNSDNCLQTINPELAKEWHPTKNAPLTPSDVTTGSGTKVWWICSKGHEWNAEVKDRSNGNGCPYCTGRKVNNDNCLQTVNPKLAKQWHPTKNARLTPNDVTISSGKKVWWICSKGHEWNTIINHRSQGSGCPYCASQKVHTDNCLQTINPELAKQWHPTKNVPLTPSDVTFSSNKKAWWFCSKDHEWQAIIGSRSQGYGCCPYCSGLKPLEEDSLATISPWIAQQWHPDKNKSWTPKDVTPHTERNIWWLCKNGHEYREPVIERYRRGGCAECILIGKKI